MIAGECHYCHSVRVWKLYPIQHEDGCPTGGRRPQRLSLDESLLFATPTSPSWTSRSAPGTRSSSRPDHRRRALGAGGDPEFAVRVAQVGLDGLLAHEEDAALGRGERLDPETRRQRGRPPAASSSSWAVRARPSLADQPRLADPGVALDEHQGAPI